MADIFLSSDACKVLSGKHIVVIGGSNMRGLYKDIVWLVNDSSLIPYECLGAKGESRFPDFNWKVGCPKKPSSRLRRIFHDGNRDNLLDFNGLHAGRGYVEPRRYYNEKHDITVNYVFVTRVWTASLDAWLESYEEKNGQRLDLILMNSCLWDVNRWGPFGIKEYKENLPKLLTTVKSILSEEDGMFIWLTAQPGSRELNSKGMNVPGLEFQNKTTRYNVVEANFYTAHKVSEAGFDVVDLHFYCLLQTFRRNRDGIHWSPEANRYVSNLILTHVALAQDKKMPGNVKDYSLQKVTFMAHVARGKITDESEIKAKVQDLNKIAGKVIGGGDNSKHGRKCEMPPMAQLQDMASKLPPFSARIANTLGGGVGPNRNQPNRAQGRLHPYQQQGGNFAPGRNRGGDGGNLNHNNAPVWQNNNPCHSQMMMNLPQYRQQQQQQQPNVMMNGPHFGPPNFGGCNNFEVSNRQGFGRWDNRPDPGLPNDGFPGGGMNQFGGPGPGGFNRPWGPGPGGNSAFPMNNMNNMNYGPINPMFQDMFGNANNMDNFDGGDQINRFNTMFSGGNNNPFSQN